MQRVSGNVRWGFEGWFHDEKKSGSVVLDLHIHDLDFLRYMLGEPDDFEVRATTFDSGMINQVITTYEFGDVFATAEGVWDVSPTPKFQAGFRAYFEDGTIYFNQAGQPGLAVYKDDGQRSFRNFIRSMRDRRIPVSTSRTSDHIIQRSSIFWNVCRMEKKSLSRRFRKA